jgi:hypothetical protein
VRNHNPINNEEPMLTTDHEIENDLIQRYKQRIKMVWKEPSPFIKPLWEISEINTKIKELQKITKK